MLSNVRSVWSEPVSRSTARRHSAGWRLGRGPSEDAFTGDTADVSATGMTTKAEGQVRVGSATRLLACMTVYELR